MKQSIMQRLVQGADLAGESLPGQPLLELYGEDRVLIENHGGITEYASQQICVQVRYGALCVSGEGLRLCRMQGQQLVITGKIQSITLVRRRS